jgi:hypothetical protein
MFCLAYADPVIGGPGVFGFANPCTVKGVWWIGSCDGGLNHVVIVEEESQVMAWFFDSPSVEGWGAEVWG